MEKPLGVVEPIKRPFRKQTFSLFGVPVSRTTFSWLAYPISYLMALPYTLLRQRVIRGKVEPLAEVAIDAQRYALLILATNYIHSLGHLLGGKAVDAPMDELIITATRHVNRYEGDQSRYRTAEHIARAAGGPLLNMLVALVAFVVARSGKAKPAGTEDFAFFNAAAALLALLPIETGDGKAILGQIQGLSKEK